MFYIRTCPKKRETDGDKIYIGCISDTYAQVMLLGVIDIYDENTFHFADRIQLISDCFTILTNNEFCTFSKNSFSIYENHATYIYYLF